MRKLYCLNGHRRTPENVNKVGACLDCRRETDRMRYRLSGSRSKYVTPRSLCQSCGHAKTMHDQGDGGRCYHTDGQAYTCECRWVYVTISVELRAQ